ncbi:MAG: DNA-binding response regulator MtrA [Verrucomicrobiae bacterium]|nr:DNA-binding response regulator MtrA [Verrucomicrobiae bacterium]
MTDKRRILMIDDDPSMSGIVKRNLEQTGTFEVRTEQRGADGLQAAREFRPDLLLLDMVMPDCDGGNVLALFRNDDELKQIPVVFLTGTISEDGMDARHGQIAGYPVVSKQAKPKTLARQIEQTLRG